VYIKRHAIFGQRLACPNLPKKKSRHKRDWEKLQMLVLLFAHPVILPKFNITCGFWILAFYITFQLGSEIGSFKKTTNLL
jgi:hypothetical protein